VQFGLHQVLRENNIDMVVISPAIRRKQTQGLLRDDGLEIQIEESNFLKEQEGRLEPCWTCAL
jgi:heterodisulfide reductase subunit A-like polyferredoxin